MVKFRNQQLCRLFAGAISIALILVAVPVSSDCSPQTHSEHATAADIGTAAGHAHQAAGQHTHHQPIPESAQASTDCCASDCQCVNTCASVPAITGTLTAIAFATLPGAFGSLTGSERHPHLNLPFRPPITA